MTATDLSAEAIVVAHSAAAVLLVISGAAKIAKPSSVEGLLGSLRIPAARRLSAKPPVLALGMAEVGVGILALAIGGPPIAAGVGVLYVVFAVTALRAASVGVASCGCFGTFDTPPTWIHSVSNAALAGVSFLAIGLPAPVELMQDRAAAGIGFVLVVGLFASLLLGLFTAVPSMSTRTAAGATDVIAAGAAKRTDLDTADGIAAGATDGTDLDSADGITARVDDGIAAGAAKRTDLDTADGIAAGATDGTDLDSADGITARVDDGIAAGATDGTDLDTAARVDDGIAAGAAKRTDLDTAARVDDGIAAGAAKRTDLDTAARVADGSAAGVADRTDRDSSA